jgi:hypothetical protein
MTPKSTLAAAEFINENRRDILSVTDWTEMMGAQEAGFWDVHWLNEDRVEAMFNAELEALARSIGWKGEGECSA